MPGKNELTDQEFVENIVKAIVDHPDEVVTGRTLDERGVLIQLTVHQEDMGKVIGREGRTAKALRSLLRVFGARNESRVNLKIVNPEGDSVSVPEEAAESVTEKIKAPKAEKVAPNIPAEEATPVPATEEKATDVF